MINEYSMRFSSIINLITKNIQEFMEIVINNLSHAFGVK